MYCKAFFSKTPFTLIGNNVKISICFDFILDFCVAFEACQMNSLFLLVFSSVPISLLVHGVQLLSFQGSARSAGAAESSVHVCERESKGRGEEGEGLYLTWGSHWLPLNWVSAATRGKPCDWRKIL